MLLPSLGPNAEHSDVASDWGGEVFAIRGDLIELNKLNLRNNLDPLPCLHRRGAEQPSDSVSILLWAFSSD